MIWGNMFNRWPYTDLENLNLDWLIGVCKEITTNWPPKLEEIENEVNNKLDKALNEGTLGDILTNNGNGTYEWKPINTAISAQIIQAVNNWLANHPEATTTVQDGSITLAKLADSLKSPFTMPKFTGISSRTRLNKYDVMSTYGAHNYALQGSEYNPIRDRYVFCFTAGSIETSLTPIIIETDSNFQFIRAKELPNAGHFNDITYDAQSDKYYACTMNVAGQIIVIDGTTLEQIEIIQPSCPGIIKMISYNPENDSFLCYAGLNADDYLYQFNNDFSSYTTLTTNLFSKATENNYPDTVRFTYSQGSTIVNNHLVMLFWFGFEHSPAITRLVIMNETNTDIEASIDYENVNINDESETIINMGTYLIVTSYFDTKIALSYLPLKDIPVNSSNTITFDNTDDPDLLDTLGVQTGAGETYKYWINFTNNPPDVLGERGKLEGGFYNNYGWQTLIEPTHYYFRKLNNGTWLPFHDILILAKETATNILTEALTNNSGGIKYLRYTGTDYSWLPFSDPNFRYALFKIDYCFSQRSVTVIDVSGRLICTNMYINNTWTGWNVEGTYSTTQNVLNLISNITRGHISIRYTGQDTAWLPGTNNKYIYGIFEITVISSNIIKVDAYAFDGTSHAVNMYVNNAWQGWKVYTAD